MSSLTFTEMESLPEDLFKDLESIVSGGDDDEDDSGGPGPGNDPGESRSGNGTLPSRSYMKGRNVSIVHDPRVEVYNLALEPDRKRYNSDMSLVLQGDGLVTGTVMKGPEIVFSPSGELNVVLVMEYKTISRIRITSGPLFTEMDAKDVRERFFPKMPPHPEVEIEDEDESLGVGEKFEPMGGNTK